MRIRHLLRQPVILLCLAVLLWMLVVAVLRQTGMPLVALDQALQQSIWHFPNLLRLPLALTLIGITLWQVWTRRAGPRSVFVVLLVLTVVCCRWNTLVGYEHCRDESESILAARNLIEDSRFWISVDVGTHGPLVSLWQTLLPALGFTVDYASSRLLGSTMLAACVIGIFYILRRVATETNARLLTLPLAFAVASLCYEDLTAYNGEHPLILLSVLSATFGVVALVPPYLTSEVISERKRAALLIVAGVFAGSVCWAKLQGLPIAAALIVVTAVGACRMAAAQSGSAKWRLAVYIIGLCVPTALILLWVAFSGSTREMLHSYFEWNLLYARRNTEGSSIASLKYVAKALIPHFPALSLFMAVLYLPLLIGSLLPLMRRSFPTKSSTTMGLIAGTALVTAAAWFSILKPGNPFDHYLLLGLFPTLLLHLLSWSLLLQREGGLTEVNHESEGRPGRYSIVLSAVVTISLLFWGFAPRLSKNESKYVARFHKGAGLTGRFQYLTAPYPKLVQATETIAKGERVALWGKTPGVFITAYSRPSTRCTVSTRESAPSMGLDMQSYFYQMYLEDWNRNPPVVFIDSMSEELAAKQQSARTAAVAARLPRTLDQMPELAARVRANYRLLFRTAEGMRFYVRSDRYQAATDQLKSLTLK